MRRIEEILGLYIIIGALAALYATYVISSLDAQAALEIIGAPFYFLNGAISSSVASSLCGTVVNGTCTGPDARLTVSTANAAVVVASVLYIVIGFFLIRYGTMRRSGDA